MPLSVVWPVACLLGTCGVNVLSLEMLVATSGELEIAGLLTLLQSLFLVGVIALRSCTPLPRSLGLRVPLTSLAQTCALSSIGGLLVNLSLSPFLPIFLMTTLRTSSLVFTLILGALFFKKRYSAPQFACCVAITVAMIALMLSRTAHANSEINLVGAWRSALYLIAGCIALPVSSLLQERLPTLATHHKSAKQRVFLFHSLEDEILFMKEATGIILCLVIVGPAALVGQWDGLLAASFEAVAIVACNIVSQYGCASSVARVSITGSALVLNLAITARKVLTIVLSAVAFQHWRRILWVEWFWIVVVLALTSGFGFLPQKNAKT